MHSSRRILSGFCTVLCVISLLLGLTYTYLARSLFDPNVFAYRVASSLDEPGVARVVAARVTDGVIEEYRDLIAYRPLLLATAEYVVSSSPFQAIVRHAARKVHATIISETGMQVTLTVADAGVVLRNALAMHPQLASKIPERATAVLTSVDDWPAGNKLLRVLRIARRMRVRAVFLLALGLGMGVAAVAVSQRRDRTLLHLGLGLTVSAYTLAGLVFFGGDLWALFMGSTPTEGLVRGLWNAFVSPLALRLLVLGSLGLVLVAAVTSLLDRMDLKVVFRAAWRTIARRPRHTALGVLRGLLLILAGLIAMRRPLETLHVLLVLAGSLLLFFGVQELFASALRSLQRLQVALGTAPARQRSPWPGIALIGSLTLLSAGAGAFWLLKHPTPAAADTELDACNGDPALCNRPFDQVTIPATHNSMSGADISDWLFPNQEYGIDAQLQDGIRGLLIDAHYAVPVGDRVKTLIDDEAAARRKYETVLGKEGIDAAMRIRDTMVGAETGEKDVYLCHGFCELGSTRFRTALEGIRNFLVSHPQEVLVLVIQDEGVSPTDLAAVFAATGLDQYVYRGPVHPPWPTLREMIDTDQRVLVCTEHNSEGVPWIHPAFGVYQETPYEFLDPTEFSCAPGRGGTTPPLFQINHWIQTAPAPRPSNAAIVNAYDFLLARARRCQKERGLQPNLVAVDFYRTGDLIRVVRTLNGLDPAPQP